MGWNTSMIVLNDALHMIEEDTQFGANVAKAVRQLNMRGVSKYRPILDVPAISPSGNSIHANAASVIEQHHADYTVLVAFGGNTARSLGHVGGYRSTDEDILRALADKMGYRIVKKAAK